MSLASEKGASLAKIPGAGCSNFFWILFAKENLAGIKGNTRTQRRDATWLVSRFSMTWAKWNDPDGGAGCWYKQSALMTLTCFDFYGRIMSGSYTLFLNLSLHEKLDTTLWYTFAMLHLLGKEFLGIGLALDALLQLCSGKPASDFECFRARKLPSCIPVVPHKAVAEVSKIGTYRRWVVVMHGWQSESTDGPKGGWSCVICSGCNGCSHNCWM